MKVLLIAILLAKTSFQFNLGECTIIPGSTTTSIGNKLEDLENFESLVPFFSEKDSNLAKSPLGFDFVAINLKLEDETQIPVVVKKFIRSDFTPDSADKPETYDGVSTEKEIMECQINDDHVYIIKKLSAEIPDTYYAKNKPHEEESDSEQKTQTTTSNVPRTSYPRFCYNVVKGYLAEDQPAVLKIRNGELAGELSLFLEEFGKAAPLPNYPFEAVSMQVDGINLAVQKLASDSIDANTLNLYDHFGNQKISPSLIGCVLDGESIYLAFEKMSKQLLDDEFIEEFKSFKHYQKADFYKRLFDQLDFLQQLKYTVHGLTSSSLMLDNLGFPRFVKLDSLVEAETPVVEIENEAYASPLQEANAPTTEFDNIYAMAMVVLVTDLGQKEEIFKLKKVEQTDKETWSELRKGPKEERANAFKNNFFEPLKSTWEEHLKFSNAPEFRTLTELLQDILIENKVDLTIEKVIKSLNLIFAYKRQQNKLMII